MEAELLHADGRKDRHDEANTRFSQNTSTTMEQDAKPVLHNSPLHKLSY